MTDYGLIALCISGALFAFNVFDRVWGGGNKAATTQADMKQYVNEEIASLRRDVFLKHDTTEGNLGQAIVAMKDMLHQMQLDAVTFRATSAETYMRRDSYYQAMAELKTDVNAGLDKVDKRLERMENTIAKNRKTDGLG
ncbi:hypothetical protein [Bradyrhizobium liaoningense]|uniref:hypothetical protein n=1 Tax=Bradyrhizobium liaoningense TaxID=43992 RepID=UPI0004B30A72|nr:hypothetical protein [Bradyrhizobium liaoningense]